MDRFLNLLNSGLSSGEDNGLSGDLLFCGVAGVDRFIFERQLLNLFVQYTCIPVYLYNTPT